ncbi:MAG: bifunctional class I SAM-dependent methyltransferase/glycosyltransferase family 2 protein [Bryobacteraceae bacterium]|jgi:SAM-dependent methyltransferase
MIVEDVQTTSLVGKDIPSKRTVYSGERVAFWDEFAREIGRWQPARRYYRAQLARLFAFSVPPGMRVLEVGCGTGDLLAALRPAYGVGIDFSAEMVSLARERHPNLIFQQADAHDFDLGEKFDFVVCSDLINDLWDVQTVLERIAVHCHPGTRLLLNFYSQLWAGPRKVAETAGLVKRLLLQNWLTVEDVSDLLYLAGFETIRHSREIMCPVRLPLLGPLANRYLVRLWPLGHLAITHMLIARPQPAPQPERQASVSVIVAARNEEGNIPQIFDRLPQMGSGTELIVVEGHSTDHTWEAAERELARRPGYPARLFRQPGKGKGDAVRLGFAEARGDLLMILDADLTVMPEDLPRFYEAWRSGRGDFINGVRLVYPMEERAMRFFNLLGNKFFSLAFSWLLGQSIKDTLCGTKVLSRRHYETIAANRSWFGEFDPFGDFDLIFGAARYNLKIVDMPVRYAERTYGETNIQRWRHGVVLLRMVLVAMRRIRFI